MGGVSVEASAESPEGSSTLYVVIGGNGTCRYSKPSAMFSTLKSNSLFSSFESWIIQKGLLKASDNVLFVCYEWLSPMMQYFDLRYQPVMTPIHESALDELVLARAAGQARVVIMGHSHGGWRAMKLAASPYLASTLAGIRRTLISIDPVSRVTCLRLRDSGCREAPRDFSDAEINYLSNYVLWFNAYQEGVGVLRSGAATGARVNFPVDANHVSIQTSQIVWQSVLHWLMAF